MVLQLGLREDNQQFSKAIRAVKAGGEVVLTERGKPIAVIRPLTAPDTPETVIDRLARERLVIPAARPLPMPRPRWKPVRITGVPFSQTICEERDER